MRITRMHCRDIVVEQSRRLKENGRRIEKFHMDLGVLSEAVIFYLFAAIAVLAAIGVVGRSVLFAALISGARL